MALVQLVAVGAQNVFLNSDPNITYWRSGFKRHTLHAVESIEMSTTGNTGFGRKFTANIVRNGDLAYHTVLEAIIPELKLDQSSPPSSSARWVSDVGFHMIDTAKLLIGGQQIDILEGRWMQILHELTVDAGLREGMDRMLGSVSELSVLTNPPDIYWQAAEPFSQNYMETRAVERTGGTPQRILHIPLKFYYTSESGLALPIIGLQYHEVTLSVELNQFSNLIHLSAGTVLNPAAPELVSAKLYIDMVFLEAAERKRMALSQSSYVIRQLQSNGAESISPGTSKIKLNFNHPVVYLVWTIQSDAAEAANQLSNYTDSVRDLDVLTSGGNPVVSALLHINGHDRQSLRTGDYYSHVQPMLHFGRIPRAKGINVFSFALNATARAPSGTLNFSRIDAAQLNITTVSSFLDANGAPATVPGCKIRVYAVSYNLLRVVGGMSGLGYSN